MCSSPAEAHALKRRGEGFSLMRRLILFRHAKAAPRAPGQGDSDRPLTMRGIEDSAATALRLARDDVIPDIVLVSPSVRTLQTWDHARSAFPHARSQIVDAIYDATTDDLTRVLAQAPHDAATVMVIGHNPGLQELSVDLSVAGGAQAHQVDQLEARFATAWAAVFLIDPDGRARFNGLVTPRGLTPEDTAAGDFA